MKKTMLFTLLWGFLYFFIFCLIQIIVTLIVNIGQFSRGGFVLFLNFAKLEQCCFRPCLKYFFSPINNESDNAQKFSLTKSLVHITCLLFISRKHANLFIFFLVINVKVVLNHCLVKFSWEIVLCPAALFTSPRAHLMSSIVSSCMAT